jgi:hypothetical protein
MMERMKKNILKLVLLILIMASNLKAQNFIEPTKPSGYSAPYAPIPVIPVKQAIDNVKMVTGKRFRK